MTDLNDDQGLDNQPYYEQILRYLEDPTQENLNAQWVKIQAANYFVYFVKPSLHRGSNFKTISTICITAKRW